MSSPAQLPRPRRELPGGLQRLLRLRVRMERRMPEFVRIDQWRYKRIEGSGWRYPRGLDSKIRRKWKGWPPCVEVGYRKPAAVRGLHPSGFVEAVIHNAEELDRLDPRTHAVRIASAVGLRKRLEILKRAIERGFYVLNPGRRALGALSSEAAGAQAQHSQAGQAQAG